VIPRLEPGPSLAVGAALLYVAVATFHTDFGPIVPGLDPSWVYAINRVSETGAVFGRDVVFTFGPLGHLLVPLDFGSNLAQAAVLWVVSQGLLVGAAAYRFLRHRRIVALLGFAVAWLVAASIGLLYEHRLLLIVGLLLAAPTDQRWAWRTSVVVGSSLAAVLSFAKVSSTVISVALIASAAIVRTIRREVRGREILTWSVLPFVAVGAVLTVALLGNPSNLVRWLARSLEFAGGYGAAMAVPAPTSVILPVILAAIVGLAAMAYVAWREPRFLIAVLPLCLLILVALRHSVVRHHGRFVPAVVLGALGVLLLLGPARRRMAVLGGAAAFVLAAALWISLVPACFCPWSIGTLGPSAGLARIGSLVEFGDTRHRLATASERKLFTDRLPADWLARIGSRSVDVIPWELAFIPANDLTWRPNPTLQTYGTFTPGLDRWAARHFGGPRGPEFLLVQFFEIDARHPMLASPAMWRSLLTRYEPVAVPPATGTFGEVALFRRRSEPVSLPLRDAGRSGGRIGEWVSIPESPDLMFASIDLRPDLGGRLAGLVWRVDPVYLDLQLPDGGTLTMRILPTTVEDGLLLNHLPMTLGELLDFTTGTVTRELVRFRIRGPGAGSYQHDFDIRWQTAPWAP
jgi:hypothetical protein